ncbi:MAG: ubiquinone/menaquinone biosynthesis methyltransferase [Verrucomicrobia bacterium]|nr:ubiquinone/menaquinone biosynthesis methyltransferase [Verrucomicrobiota bacterium]
MSNRFYDTGAARSARVEELFGTIATRYDLLNDIQSLGLHRLWKRRLVRLARLKPGEAALDVCCGTGDIAFRLAEEGGQVVGLDFTEAMLSVARGRVEKPRARGDVGRPGATRSLHSPEFVLGDAMRLPFGESQFSVVTIAYGLRNLADWKVGLREMTRVARSGGRILVLDFGKPRNAIFRAVYFCYLRILVPLFGFVFCGNAAAYGYILESLQHYPAQDGVESAMRELGLEEVSVYNLMGGMMSINMGVKAGMKVIAKPPTD